jgi:hypothetical protein
VALLLGPQAQDVALGLGLDRRLDRQRPAAGRTPMIGREGAAPDEPVAAGVDGAGATLIGRRGIRIGLSGTRVGGASGLVTGVTPGAGGVGTIAAGSVGGVSGTSGAGAGGTWVCVVVVVVVVLGGAAGGVTGVSAFGAGGFSASFLLQPASASAQRPTVIQRPIMSSSRGRVSPKRPFKSRRPANTSHDCLGHFLR